MIVCDLCGQARECLQKDIDGKEYDVCAECWESLAVKLKGKGRVQKRREPVVLPPIIKEPHDPKEPHEPRPPMEPPKIWGRLQ
jgi:ribosome-binding protein aMBF1 (putative translation factor)